jgi:hypothetical protein
MKETYLGPAYGLGNWRKTDTFTRTVYDFSGRKRWTEKAIEIAIWSGFLTMIALVVSLFV